MNLSRNSSSFYFPISTFNPLNSAALGLSYQHYDDWSDWSDCILIMVDCLIEWRWSSLVLLSIWLLKIWLIPETIYFTYKLYAWVIGVAIKTCYSFYKSDFYRFDLSLRQFTLLINCTLGSIIHLSPNAVMTTKLFSHKSKFICYFKIAALS